MKTVKDYEKYLEAMVDINDYISEFGTEDMSLYGGVNMTLPRFLRKCFENACGMNCEFTNTLEDSHYYLKFCLNEFRKKYPELEEGFPAEDSYSIVVRDVFDWQHKCTCTNNDEECSCYPEEEEHDENYNYGKDPLYWYDTEENKYVYSPKTKMYNQIPTAIVYLAEYIYYVIATNDNIFYKRSFFKTEKGKRSTFLNLNDNSDDDIDAYRLTIYKVFDFGIYNVFTFIFGKTKYGGSYHTETLREYRYVTNEEYDEAMATFDNDIVEMFKINYPFKSLFEDDTVDL